MYSTNPLPDFYELLDQAHASSDASDAYDLHSENPASVSYYRELNNAHRSDARALIRYVLENGDALLAQLTAPAK